jgi:hypothetical protein
VSPAIVEEHSSKDQNPTNGFVCVLFMNIRGFTRLVEEDAREVGPYMPFSAAIKIVDRNRA